MAQDLKMPPPPFLNTTSTYCMFDLICNVFSQLFIHKAQSAASSDWKSLRITLALLPSPPIVTLEQEIHVLIL